MRTLRCRTTALVAALAAAAVALSAGCGSKSPTGPSAAGGNVLFYSQAKSVAPVFIPGARTGALRAAGPLEVSPGWENGNPVYMLYDLLRNFEHPADEGRIDSHNLYKVLFDAGLMYASGATSPQNRSFAATSVASTFDFGTAPGAYTSGGAKQETGSNNVVYSKSWAYRVDGTRTSALLTWIYDISPTHQERGVTEATFDETTGEIELNMANFVWYSDTEWFSIRTWVTGNTFTHAFTLKGLNRGRSAYGESHASFAGGGVSRGAGEYFLFDVHVVNNGTDEGVFHYKVPADAGEDSLRTLAATGIPGGFDEGNDPRNYRARVPVTRFAAADGAESMARFANGNMLLLP